MKKFLGIISIVSILVFSLAGAVLANALLVDGQKAAEPQQVGNLGWIHWDKGLAKAVGTSTNKDAKLAQEEATKNAYANLGQLVDSIPVKEKETVKDLTAKDSDLQNRVKNFVNGALVLDQQKEKDGSFRVVVAINLFGNNGLANLFNTPPDSTAPTASAGYSGLVIDVTGLGLQRCPVPKVYDDTGAEVYGTMTVDSTYLEEKGIVSYAFSPELVKAVKEGKSRAGANPLIIQAIGVRDKNVNVIIKKSDAEKVLAADKESGFLKKYAVVIQQN